MSASTARGGARREDDWVVGWWHTMRATILLLLAAIPLSVVAVALMPRNTPFALLGAVYSAWALSFGFLIDYYRLNRRNGN